MAQDGGVAAQRIDRVEHHEHHYPAPTSAPVWRPVRVGAVPPLASAFQPRTDLSEQIDRARARHTTVVLTQVLSGGGGVGKSQLAASCAHRALAEGVDVLVWVNASDTSQIVATYAQAAARVHVPDTDGQDAEADASAFLDWLAITDRTWLVVLDDLTDVEGAQPWWPRPAAGTRNGGRVLATTRRRDALVSGAGRAIVDIGTYTRAEAFAYLHERLTEAGTAHLLDDHTSDLIEALGRLPLALAHAAAYLINEDADCTRYLRLFTDRASPLDAVLPPGADTDGYGRQVTASLLLALDAAQLREPVGLATPVIRLAAHLDPAGHPLGLWTTTAVTHYLDTHRAPQPPGTPNPAPVTPDQAHSVLRLLHHYALLTSDTRYGDRAVRLHSLTARAARETVPPAGIPAVIHAAADALDEIWPEHQHAALDLTAVLRANTDTLATHAGDLLWQIGGHPVLLRAGHSLAIAGQFSAAVAYCRHNTATSERLLGNDHSYTSAARAVLAAASFRAGLTSEAIDLLELVLVDRHQRFGSDHPDTLAAIASLAACYQEVGRTDEAIGLQEHVLIETAQVHGNHDLDTLTTRANLASSYGSAGRTNEAVDLLESVLADMERLLGNDHPNTLTARANLATFYFDAGRVDEAIGIEEQVLADSDRLFGSDHPDTLAARASLAVSYRQAGLVDEGINLLESALADAERLLGNDHPNTLATRGYLAISYLRARPRRIGEAIDVGEHVLADCERLLGSDHPNTLTACAHLATSYMWEGNLDRAIDLLEQAHIGREQLFGKDHPSTQELAVTLQDWRMLHRGGKQGHRWYIPNPEAR